MNLPTVYLVMVASIDGTIAEGPDEFINWSSAEDKKYFSEFTKEIGCVISGSNTFDTLKKPFKDRQNIILTSRPDEYKEKFKEYDNVHFLSAQDPREVLEYAKSLGFEKVILGGGSATNSFFAKSELIDYIYLTIEPHVSGAGLRIFSEKKDLNLKLIETDKLNESTLLLKYEVLKQQDKAD